MLKVIKATPGMPVTSWAIVGPSSPVISGFESPEAAQAWASEWNETQTKVIAPVIGFGPATEALTAYERHAQGLEEGEEWKRGKNDE